MKTMKVNIQKYLSMHDSVVKEVLDKTDIPFARVETTWFKKGQQHRYKGKMLKIECEEPILISSYIDMGDGRTLRISNHEKKQGIPPKMLNCVYEWQTGKLDNKVLNKIIGD